MNEIIRLSPTKLYISWSLISKNLGSIVDDIEYNEPQFPMWIDWKIWLVAYKFLKYLWVGRLAYNRSYKVHKMMVYKTKFLHLVLALHHISGSLGYGNPPPSISRQSRYHRQAFAACQSSCLNQGFHSPNFQQLKPTAVNTQLSLSIHSDMLNIRSKCNKWWSH